MKIVQFKDGRYGIRKLTLFGYRFLGKYFTEDYWWGEIQDFVPIHAAMTEEEVIDRWKRFPLKKKPKEVFDIGKPVNVNVNGIALGEE